MRQKGFSHPYNEAKRFLTPITPVSNHEKTSDKPRLVGAIQDTWLILHRTIKVMNNKEREKLSQTREMGDAG